jgi:hypothetical protein
MLRLQVYVWKILIVYITQQDAPHKDKILQKVLHYLPLDEVRAKVYRFPTIRFCYNQENKQKYRKYNEFSILFIYKIQ